MPPASPAVRHFRPPSRRPAGHCRNRCSGGSGMEDGTVMKCSLLGTLAGVAVGWLPGLSTASANSVLASVIGYGEKAGGRIFLQPTRPIPRMLSSGRRLSSRYYPDEERGDGRALRLPLPSMSELVVNRGACRMCCIPYHRPALPFGSHRLCGIDSLLLNRAVIDCVLLLHRPYRALRCRDSSLATAIGLVPYLVNVPRVYCHGCHHVPL